MGKERKKGKRYKGDGGELDGLDGRDGHDGHERKQRHNRATTSRTTNERRDPEGELERDVDRDRSRTDRAREREIDTDHSNKDGGYTERQPQYPHQQTLPLHMNTPHQGHYYHTHPAHQPHPPQHPHTQLPLQLHGHQQPQPQNPPTHFPPQRPPNQNATVNHNYIPNSNANQNFLFNLPHGNIDGHGINAPAPVPNSGPLSAGPALYSHALPPHLQHVRTHGLHSMSLPHMSVSSLPSIQQIQPLQLPLNHIHGHPQQGVNVSLSSSAGQVGNTNLLRQNKRDIHGHAHVSHLQRQGHDGHLGDHNEQDHEESDESNTTSRSNTNTVTDSQSNTNTTSNNNSNETEESERKDKQEEELDGVGRSGNGGSEGLNLVVGMLNLKESALRVLRSMLPADMEVSRQLDCDALLVQLRRLTTRELSKEQLEVLTTVRNKVRAKKKSLKAKAKRSQANSSLAQLARMIDLPPSESDSATVLERAIPYIRSLQRENQELRRRLAESSHSDYTGSSDPNSKSNYSHSGSGGSGSGSKSNSNSTGKSASSDTGNSKSNSTSNVDGTMGTTSGSSGSGTGTGTGTSNQNETSPRSQSNERPKPNSDQKEVK